MSSSADENGVNTYSKRTRIEAPAEQVYRWHARPGAVHRLIPPWENVSVLDSDGGIEAGKRVRFEMRMGPLRRQWLAEHREPETKEGLAFRDVQIEGPFASWDHHHIIVPDGDEACFLEDRVRYRIPGGPLGRVLGRSWVQQKLDRMFEFRHEVTARENELHHHHEGIGTVKVLITGSTGLVGKQLSSFLTTGGHEVTGLQRGSSGPEGAPRWNPAEGTIDDEALEGFDAVVHLAGESIADGRWTDAKKARIRESRVEGTRLLADTLARLDSPPKVLVAASAIGYYGNRGDTVLDESAKPGTGFLPEVCIEWENAAKAAEEAGIRVAHLRFGIILSPDGGALAKMLFPFRMGGGGKLGDGTQWMSWIALPDAVSAAHHAIVSEDVRGPVNVVAPNPVTNEDFTKTLGKVLSRPTLIPMPAFAARIVFGELADALLLSSTRVVPKVLENTGHDFQNPELEGALRHLLGK